MFKPKYFSVFFVLNVVLLLQICHPIIAQQRTAMAVKIDSFLLRYNRLAFKAIDQAKKESCVLCALYHAICILSGKEMPQYHPDEICKRIDCKTQVSVAKAVKALQDPTTKTICFYDSTKSLETLKTMLKAEIRKNHPVILLIRYDESVKNNLKGDFMNAPKNFKKVSRHHAVCVVGYRETDNPLNTDSYIEILNSWGPTWGSNGYAKIMWIDLDLFVKEAHSIKINQ
jgi:Papain family cysteine protease